MKNYEFTSGDYDHTFDQAITNNHMKIIEFLVHSKARKYLNMNMHLLISQYHPNKNIYNYLAQL